MQSRNGLPEEQNQAQKSLVLWNGLSARIKLQRFFGWTWDKHWGRAKKLLIFCYGGSTFSLILGLFVGDVLSFFYGYHELSPTEFFTSFILVSNGLGSIFGVILIIFYGRDLSQMNAAFNETANFAFEYSQHISDLVYPRSRWLSNAHLIMISVFIYSDSVFWFSTALIAVIREYPTVDYGKIQLPHIRATYGLNQATNFWTIYILQTVSFGIVVASNILTSALLPSMCALIRGQLTILARSFSRVIRPQDQPTAERVDKDMLEHCIVHHQMILRVLNQFKLIAAPHLLLNISNCTGILINSTVAATWADGSYTMAVSVSTAMLSSSLMFYWAWHLQSLQQSFRDIGFAAYLVGHFSPEARRDVALIISRSNRVEKFSNFFNMSFRVASINKILDLAWNYFTLCRRKAITKAL